MKYEGLGQASLKLAYSLARPAKATNRHFKLGSSDADLSTLPAAILGPTQLKTLMYCCVLTRTFGYVNRHRIVRA